MADKEATVYIVDVGRSMKKRHHGRDESDLDWGMRYVWDKITTAVSTGRKTIMLAVIGLGTEETQNELGHEEGYHHISVLQPISQIMMPDLRKLDALIKPSNTDDRDAVSAIIIAIQMISNHCKKNKWKRKIVVVTNGSGVMDVDPDNGQDIVKKINADGIELVVLGIDFDDAEYGFKEESKSLVKAKNEDFLRDLAQQCSGVFGTMQEAIDELSIPRVKIVKPTPSYKGQLRLGDPDQYDTALCIDVERYPRTFVAKPATASSFVLRTQGPGDSMTSSATLGAPGDQAQSSQANSGGLTVVRNQYSYQVKDEEVEGGKREVAREDLAKGYEYGRTAVHINESDENITKLETEASMEILGFIARARVSGVLLHPSTESDYVQVERYMLLDTSNIIIPQKTNDKAIMALSSFVHALFELESCAVARFVRKDMTDPLLTILTPSVQNDYECLIENQLPFTEDVRPYRFPPLDKIVTVSGKILTQHRNLPSQELLSAMGDFVDSMDLSSLGMDEDGKPAEHVALEDTFSPVLHRIEQAKRWRAVHPTDPIPRLPEVLVQYSKPPEELLSNSESALKRLMKAADVKRVPPKVKGRKRNRDVDKPLSGLDVDDLFRKEKRTKISPENAIPEFKQTLASTEDLDEVKDAVNQMNAIVQDQIKHSFGDNNYERVIEGLGVMRQELVELEEPRLYNDMIRELKTKILAEELGGNRQEMWWHIKKSRLGLIDKRRSHVSDVTEEDASAFLTTK